MLKFKVDENLPIEVAALLTQAGHDAVTMLDQHMGGGSDRELSRICREEARGIVSLDLDFADIRHYPPADYRGIIVLRLVVATKSFILSAIKRLIPVLEREEISGKLWIVDDSRIRIRG